MHFKWVPTKQSKKNATRKSLSRVTLLLLLRRRSFNPFTPCQLRKPPRCQPRRGQITARGSADTTAPRLKCDYCDKGAHRKRSIKKFVIKTNQTGFIRKLSMSLSSESFLPTPPPYRLIQCNPSTTLSYLIAIITLLSFDSQDFFKWERFSEENYLFEKNGFHFLIETIKE